MIRRNLDILSLSLPDVDKLKTGRYRPSEHALSFIRPYKKSARLIRMKPFQRLVREITKDIGREKNIKKYINRSSIHILRDAAEAYFVDCLRDASTVLGERVAVIVKNIRRYVRD